MKFELAVIVLAAIIAIILLLLFCCFRQYTNRCEFRRRPHALQFDDDLSRKHLLEEGEDELPNQRSSSEQQRPPQNRYFILGGHRFEATASGYRQIEEEASYDPNEAQKLGLHADDSHVNVAVNNEYMVGSEENPKPHKTRHPLAVQFSAMAHAAESETSGPVESNASREFMYATKPSDNYVWPSKGGPASPIHVEWSGNTQTMATKEQNFKLFEQQISNKDESALEAPSNETTAAEDLVQKEETGENPELLVKTDQQIVPKPKSKKGKKKQQQQQQQEEQIES